MSTSSDVARSRLTTRLTTRAVLLPAAADVVCVLVFALAGKGSHEPGESSWVVLAIAWPFVVAALAAHLGLALAARSSLAVRPGGLVVLGTTYVVGMALRVASGRGIAVGFLVVALIFLSVTLLGWRALRARMISA